MTTGQPIFDGKTVHAASQGVPSPHSFRVLTYSIVFVCHWYLTSGSLSPETCSMGFGLSDA